MKTGPSFPSEFDPVNTLRPIFVVGTRPEAIKIFPVVLAMESDPLFDPIVIASGQHPDMCTQVLRMAGIEPDIILSLHRESGTLSELVAQLVSELTTVFADLINTYNPPGYLPRIPATFVHGDTSTALAAALVSAFTDLPVVHVEAGLRTYDLHGPFPEELNRQLIARMAVLSIAPTMPSEANLIRESIASEQILVAGNTGIDALLWAVRQPVEFSDPALRDVMDSDGPVIVVTAHRRENWTHLEDIASALVRICRERRDVRVVLPLHPNPNVKSVFVDHLGSEPQILLTEPLGYVEFAHVLKRATICLTDSGGIQEEAPSLHTPVLVMREQTERPEGVVAGTLRLVGVDPDEIVKQALQLLDDPAQYDAMASADNPYGDGLASQRIVQALQYILSGKNPPEPFGPGISRAFILARTGLDYGSLRHQQPDIDL